MGNQVHSIHLPDSFPFLKGALLWTAGAALQTVSPLTLWDSLLTGLQEALS